MPTKNPIEALRDEAVLAIRALREAVNAADRVFTDTDDYDENPHLCADVRALLIGTELAIAALEGRHISPVDIDEPLTYYHDEEFNRELGALAKAALRGRR